MSKNNEKIILLSTHDGDIGHKTFYEPQTNTKIDSNDSKTNRQCNNNCLNNFLIKIKI